MDMNEYSGYYRVADLEERLVEAFKQLSTLLGKDIKFPPSKLPPIQKEVADTVKAQK